MYELNKESIISERVYGGRQSWEYTLIIRHGNVRLSVEIDRDAYDFQSSAKVSKWDGDKWHHVYDEPIERCICKKISYVQKDVTVMDFRPDAVRLLETATQII